MQEFIHSYWQNLKTKELSFQTNTLNLLSKIAENQEGFVQINSYDTYNSLNPSFSVRNLNGTQAYILLKEDETAIEKKYKNQAFFEYSNLKDNLLIINELSWFFIKKSGLKKFHFNLELPPNDKQINTFLKLLQDFLSTNSEISQEVAGVIQNLANYSIILRNGIENKLKIEAFKKEKSSIWQTYTYFSTNLDSQITTQQFASDVAASFVWLLIFAKMQSQDEELTLENAPSFLPKSLIFLQEYLHFFQALSLSEFEWVSEEIIHDFNYLNPAIFDFQNQENESLDELYTLFCGWYYQDTQEGVPPNIAPELAKSIAKNLNLLLKEYFEYKTGLANRHKVSFFNTTNSNSLTLEVLKAGIAGVPSYSPRFALTVRKFLLQKIVSIQSQVLPYVLEQIHLTHFFKTLAYPVNLPEKWQLFLGDFHIKNNTKKPQKLLSLFEKEQKIISQFENDFLITATSIFGNFETIAKKITLLLTKVGQKEEQISTILIDTSFLDATFFRRVRAELLAEFDKILVFDFHGNQKINEISPNGEPDENILGLDVGVSLLLCIKKEGLEKAVQRFDFFGQKEEKFKFLSQNTLQTITWQKLNPQSPNFALKDYNLLNSYKKGYPIDKIFKSKENPLKFQDKECSFRSDELHTHRILCRPFDFRWVIRASEQSHQENYFLHLVQKNKGNPHTYSITNSRVSKNYFEGEKTHSFPLYTYQKNEGLGLFSSGGVSKGDNFTQEFRNYIQDLYKQKVDAKDVLAHIYATLWSQKYQSEYAHFLKDDFPSVSFPKVKSHFKKSVSLGKKLIQVHCFEKVADKLLASNLAKIKHLQKGKKDFHFASFESMQVLDKQDFITLKINQNLHLEKIPKAVYEFRMGNTKPVQNYLLARQKRILTQEELENFSRLIRMLAFSQMQEV